VETKNKEDGRVLIAVLAHPDDETFGMGGTLARYAQEGASVYLICATRGEVGEMDPKYMKGFKDVSERREAELRCAAEKLGLKDVFFLGYRDSGMPGSVHNQHPQSLVQAPVEQVASEVAMYIRQHRPQVVVTFDPIGGYRHPDHIAIHQATIRAFELAGVEVTNSELDTLEPFKPNKLYYHTFPRAFLRLALLALRLIGKDPRKFGQNKDIDLQSIAEVNFPIHAVISYYKDAHLRDEASACHASQGGTNNSGGLLGWMRRIFGSKDLYMRVIPEPVRGEKKEKDLFASLN
jgi:LmbE family N-acetylglucosaminyl deacetylase